MMKFERLPKPIEAVTPENEPYQAYVLLALQIPGPDGLMIEMQCMCLVHDDFEANAAVLRERVENFFNTLLDGLPVSSVH